MAAIETVHPLRATDAVESGTESTINETDVKTPAEGKLLIVDPAAARRYRLVEMLGDVAGKPIEVNTTTEALATLSKHHVDLVLVDLRVPEIGATNFCREMRKVPLTKFTPIFVLAESHSLDAEVEAIEAGANEFLTVPLRDRAFRARVQASLRQKSMVDSLDDAETILFSLAKSVEDRDPDLSLHCQRLSYMSAAMGVALKLPAHDILALQRGGYLHDIGKISIPDRILFKPGPLTPDEWEVMKSHTVRGERICTGIRSLAPVLPIIRGHHERWDGLGYPDGLKGEQIPLLARILQLADIYDALTTVRPYKRAMTPDEGLAIMMDETAKGWRDPQLMRVFADILPMFRSGMASDLSRFSLRALARSVEAFQADQNSSELKQQRL